MQSASITVDILCAINIFVTPSSFLSPSLILLSVALSTALVESSKIIILGFLRSARAMQRRCFCPPETFTPPCPRSVSRPAGNRCMNSLAHAVSQASQSSASLASLLPHLRLSLIVPLKRRFFCRTIPTASRRVHRL